MSELDIRPTNPWPMPGVLVTMCVCRRAVRRPPARVARAAGWTEDIAGATGCGAGCGLCRPYLRRMLATGETDFHELLTEDPGGSAGSPRAPRQNLGERRGLRP